MREFVENMGRIDPPAGAASMTLDYEQRCRGRFLVLLDDGTEAGVVLPHASRRLAGGDVLRTAGNETAVIRCRLEDLSWAEAPDWPTLAKAAYHFGNRHAALQFEGLRLRFQPDSALERLAAGLGLATGREMAVFDPEPGAAGGGGHVHAGGIHGWNDSPSGQAGW
ncbi:MAG: urease accessory protein UreE [Planctomycetota bacterium]|jgi:urease accessory protein|nr:urease accessory protein UreE [Planctomycetota bacterium]